MKNASDEFKKTLEYARLRAIYGALLRADNSKVKAAKELGISLRTVRNSMELVADYFPTRVNSSLTRTRNGKEVNWVEIHVIIE